MIPIMIIDFFLISNLISQKFKYNLVTIVVTIYKPLFQKMKLNLLKENKTVKNIFLALSVLLGFIFVALFSSIYVSDAIKNNNACGCVIPIPFMILILSSLGLFSGCLSFYILISKHLKEKREITKNIEFTLKFLDGGERIIINELIKNKGGLNQSKFEKLTGLHKVKIHRIINRLESKGLIEKNNIGKVNTIKLCNELKEVFS